MSSNVNFLNLAFIHLFIYIAPLQGNYSEALPTPRSAKKGRFSMHDLEKYRYTIYRAQAQLL